MVLPKLKNLPKLKDLPGPIAKLVVGSGATLALCLGLIVWASFGLNAKDEKKTETVASHGEELQEPSGHEEEGELGSSAIPPPIAVVHPHGTKAKEAHSDASEHGSHGEGDDEARGSAHGGHGEDHAASGHAEKLGHGASSDSHSAAQAEKHSDSHTVAHSDASVKQKHGQPASSQDSRGKAAEGHADNQDSHGDQNSSHDEDLGEGGDGELIRQLVQEYAQNGQIDKALPFVDRALAAGGNPPEFLALAARILMAHGRYAQARDLAETALIRLPQRKDLSVLAMMAQYREGKVDEAMVKAMELLQKQPRDVDLLTALGTMHSEQRPEDATADGYLAQALKIKPKHIPALYQVGRREMRAKQFVEAQKTFERILEWQPGYAKAQAQLGMALYYQEQFEEARQALITALKRSPKDYNTWYNLGEVYLQQAGQVGVKQIDIVEAIRQRAFTCYNQTIDLQPQHPQAHFRLGMLLLGNNQPKEAARHLEFAVQKQKDWVAAWLQLSLAYEALEQFDKAREAITKAYALDPLNKVVALKMRNWG